MNNVVEICEAAKGGRRNIKMILLTIHKDGETNDNGINWKEDYVKENMESLKSIPICCSFADSDKTIPLDHGYTETVELENGRLEPLYNNSECVGVIERGEIEDVSINGVPKRVLVGYGYLFCQRYKAFTDRLKNNVETSAVKSSVEIVGKNHGNIIYEGGYNEKYRVPKIFDFSATAILGVKVADENAYVLEINEKTGKEKTKMDETLRKDIKSVIETVIKETNSVKQENADKIAELNGEIEKKNKEITELSEAKTGLEKDIADRDNTIAEINEKISRLEKEIAAYKKKELISELNEKLSRFSENEKAYATAEINSFNENPVREDIENIVSKICVGIVSNMRKDGVNNRLTVENNSSRNNNWDIFTPTDSENDEKYDNDINIY